MFKGEELCINKGTKFYKVIETNKYDNTDFSLDGKILECVIKESLSTRTKLFHLTEENEGIHIIDKVTGLIALSIDADKTNVDVDTGFYTIFEKDLFYPLEDRTAILYGSIVFNKGVSV